MTPRRRAAFEVAALLVLAGGAYFPRLTTLPLRGEEPRRATVAVEILATGDWVVPRQQGEIYLSRPPAGSWPIAALGLLRGGVDDFSVRAPTAAAVLLTVLLIYWYAAPRTDDDGATRGVPGCGAFCAAAGFAGMFQVLRLGRLAETEGVFTLLVAASLLGWHGLYTRGRPAWVCWAVGYSLAGLAGLTKGPQGPIYFAAATWGYCLLKRDWRMLCGFGHLIGTAGFLATAGVWQALYVDRAGWENGVNIWRQQSGDRFNLRRPGEAVAHWLTFPLWAFACTLPGSALAPALFSRRVRGLLKTKADERRRGDAGDLIFFCAHATFWVALPIWLAPDGNARYAMPGYPLVAVLGGAAVEALRRAAVLSLNDPEAGPLRWWRRSRSAGLTGGAVALPVAAAAFVILPTVRPELNDLNQSFAADAALLVVCGSAGAALWVSRGGSARWTATAAAGLTAAAGVAYVGPFTTSRAAVAIDVRTGVAGALAALPPGADLASAGRLNHNVRYYLREHAAARPGLAPLPIAGPDGPDGPAAGLYLWVNKPDEIPPGAAVVAEVPVGRNRRAPQDVISLVRVGPRRTAAADGPPAR